MAILQSCCCWKSVRKGSYASAIYTALYFTITAAFISSYLHDELEHFRSNTTIVSHHSFLDPDVPSLTSLVFTILQLSLSSFGILASLMLVYGLYRNQKFLLIPWIFTVMVFTVSDLVYCIYLFVDYTIKVNPIHAILFTLDFFVVTLNTYALLCVISEYQELKMGRGRAQDDQILRIPNCIVYSAQPTATSYMSSKRGVTYFETKPTPTQSPTGTNPPGFDEPMPIVSKIPRKSVKFPDDDENENDQPWTIDVKSPSISVLTTKSGSGVDTAPLISEDVGNGNEHPLIINKPS